MHQESSLVGEVFFALCKTVNSPVSLGAWLRYKYSHRELADMSIKPKDYDDASRFQLDYLCVSLLSKYKGLCTGYDLESEALQKFSTSEVHCRESNRRIRNGRYSGSEAGLGSILFTAQRKIASLLGPFSWFKVSESYGWGPGATSSIPRRRAFVDTKLCQLPISVTSKALPIFLSELTNDLHWSSCLLGVSPSDILGRFEWLPSCFSVTEACIIDTVPKNSKTHRVIAKEPTANGFLQKGFGAYFRSRLSRVGIDLNDQALNQNAAKAAFSECLATIDLKAASDSVCQELVYALLPIDWAMALDDIRSKRALLPDGSEIALEKFSSMGNGFTFELESLIFWALSSAVFDTEFDREKVWVYGDDIICHQRGATRLIEVLNYVGFEVNTSKSYVSGAFYESCGKHFFEGYEVTPIYQKEIPNNFSEVIRFGNRLMRYALATARGRLNPAINAAWHRVWRYGSSYHHFQLPLGVEGDDGWLLPAEAFASRPQDLNFGIQCRVFSYPRKRFPAHEGALLAYSLRRGVVTDRKSVV